MSICYRDQFDSSDKTWIEFLFVTLQTTTHISSLRCLKHPLIQGHGYLCWTVSLGFALSHLAELGLHVLITRTRLSERLCPPGLSHGSPSHMPVC